MTLLLYIHSLSDNHFFKFTVLGNSQILDQVVDCDSGGVSKHLGQIADSMYEWEGPVADQLGLSQVDITAIKTAHPMKFSLQV